MRLPVFRIFKLVFPFVSASSHVSFVLVLHMHASFDSQPFVRLICGDFVYVYFARRAANVTRMHYIGLSVAN
jgi:hypothetical protein